MEATPLRMLSLLRRTHTVQLITVIIVYRLTPTEAIAIAPAISSAPASSYTPASASAPAGLSTQRPPSIGEFPDLSSRTLGPTQHSHRFPWLQPNVCTHVYPERAGIPRLKGSCHSSLGSSGDISISHSGVSHGHRNVPQTS